VKRFALLLALAALAALSGGCGSKGSPADAPANVKVVAGDSAVTVSWTMEPDVDYWIFYGPTDSITTSNWSTIGGSVIPQAVSPRLVTNLVNGRTYSFTINGRRNGGPGGSGTPSLSAVPRLAGSVWTAGAPLGSGRLSAIATGLSTAGNANVTVGGGGAIYSSVNGAATTPATNPAAPADLNAVWFVNGPGFVAAGAGGTIVSSPDATTWTAKTSGTTATLYAGASTGISGLVAVGAAGTLITSTDGNTWNAQVSGTTNHLYAAIYAVGRYVVAGANGTLITSLDGLTWQTVASGTTRDLRGLAFAVLNPLTTTQTVVLVAVGAGGTLLTSNDGLTWTLQPPISANDFASVTRSSQFVAVGNAGSIYTSVDGVTWQAQTSGTTRDLTAVTGISAGYAAVGDAGTNLFSY
jgi:predicted small lipoprotein YifL